MDRSNISRKRRFPRSSWWLLPGLLAVFFWFVGIALPSSASSVYAASRSSLMASTTSCVHISKLMMKCSIVNNHTRGRKPIITPSPTKSTKTPVITPSPTKTHKLAYLAPQSVKPAMTHKILKSTTSNTKTVHTSIANPLRAHSLSVVTTPPTFQSGQNVSYSIVVSNSNSAGPVLAGDPITINDPIPAGLTNLAVSSNSDWTTSLSATTSPATLTATYVGTYPVASGATLSTITVTGTLTSASVPTLSNTATVTTPDDSNTDNNAGTSTNPILAQPDLAITETAPTGTTFEVGKTATFTITASDSSTAGPVLTGNAITITSAIPAGLTGLTASANSDWTITFDTTTGPATMTATYVGTTPVNPGTTLSPITLTGTLTTAATPSLTNPVAVTTPHDSDLTNNTASVTIPVVPQPDMTVTETVPTGAIFQVGKTATFTIVGSNVNSAGPVLAGDPIVITSAIPAGLTGLTASSNSDWTITFDTTTSPATMTATYVGTYPVDPGTALSPITLTGTLTTASLTSLTNPATVSTPNDSNSANNTTSVTISVLAQPDLSLTKTMQLVSP